MRWYHFQVSAGADVLRVRTIGLPHALQVWRSVERLRSSPCNLRDRPFKVRSRWAQGERSADWFTLMRIFIGFRSLLTFYQILLSCSTVYRARAGAGLRWCGWRGDRRLVGEPLLRVFEPKRKHRQTNASDQGPDPLLPCHACKLKQHGVHPAHGILAGKPILGGGTIKPQDCYFRFPLLR
jgi:hypothetical protein